MAKAGKPKPAKSSLLYGRLHSYNKKDKFIVLLKKLRPDWFIGCNKKVKNLDTNEIFNSLREADKSVNMCNGSVWAKLQTTGVCGGQHFAYCDENGNIIDKKLDK